MIKMSVSKQLTFQLNKFAGKRHINREQLNKAMRACEDEYQIIVYGLLSHGNLTK